MAQIGTCVDMATKESSTKYKVVKTAQERFDAAFSYFGQNKKLAATNTLFSMGQQWSPQEREKRDKNGRLTYTDNITEQHIFQVVNVFSRSKLSARLLPIDDGADKKTAQIGTGLLRDINARSNGDAIRTIAFNHAVRGGEGFWRVIYEYESPDSMNFVIRLKPCNDPSLVLIDPAAQLPDKSDAKWGFIFDYMRKSQIKKLYNRDTDGGLPFDSSIYSDNYGNGDDDPLLRIAEYFYSEEKKDTLIQLVNGKTLYKSQLKGVEVPVEYIKAERETLRQHWYYCKIVDSSYEAVDWQEWPGKYLPIIRTVGVELTVEGKTTYRGLTDALYGGQMMVNLSMSSALEALASSTGTPIIAAVDAVSGLIDAYKNLPIEMTPIILHNHKDENGNPIPSPSRMQPVPVPAAALTMLNTGIENMRAASGQQNANFGIKGDAESGVGIQKLKMQGEIAVGHFTDNISIAIRYEGMVVWDLIQQVYTAPQVARILGRDIDDVQTLKIDPTQEQAYSEEQDENGEIQRIFNPNVGRYDVIVDVGLSYMTQQQETMDNFTKVMMSNPALAANFPDLYMKLGNLPDEFIERAKMTLPPQLQALANSDPKENKVAQFAKLQQELEQTKVMLQESQTQKQELEQTIAAKQLEVNAKLSIENMKNNTAMYNAETNRLGTLAPAVDPANLREMVRQLVSEIISGEKVANEMPMGSPPVTDYTGNIDQGSESNGQY
jgi:hypothetical protein